MKRAQIQHFFETLQQANPKPVTELHYGNHFQLLAAVLLSAQATDASVNKATAHLFDQLTTPQDVIDLGLPALTQALSTLNLYKTKAKHLYETCERLVACHGGQVPHDRAALEALPGVGRKTASVVLNVAFNEPCIPVDTHIFRVANRTGLAPGPTPASVEAGLMKRVPEAFRLHAHHWLILHGRYVCKARQPACDICAVSQDCDSRPRPYN